MYGINAACIEGVDPYKLDDIEIFDGINHPLDKIELIFMHPVNLCYTKNKERLY